MKFFRKVNHVFTKRIQRQFLIPFLFLILLTGVVVAGTSYWFSLNNTTEAMTKNVERQMESMSSSFDTLFNTMSHNVNRFAEDSKLADQEANESEILNQFESASESNPSILNIYVGNSSTKNMLIYPATDLGDDYDPTTRPWYQEAVDKQGEVIWTEPYVDAATGDAVVSAARAVERNGGVEAVFSIDFTVGTLLEMMDQVQVGETGNGMLLSDNGIILAHPDEGMIGESAEGMEYYEAVASQEQGSYEYTENGEKKIVAFATNPQTGWKMMGVVNVSDFQSQANQIILPILIVLLGVILISLVIAILVTRHLTKPIKELQLLMSRAGSGDFSMNAEMDRADEIGDLSRDFQQMLYSIRGLLHKVKSSSTSVSSSAENVVANAEENSAAAHEISRAIQEIAAGAQTQTEMMEQSVQSSQVLATTITGVVNQSEQMKEKSDSLMSRSEQAQQIVQRLREHSDKTNHMTNDMKRSIEELQASSESINKVVSTISGIAGQTNLLALNAAIEAARAGEAGKGFAVVADEVRKLAEQSESALTDVSEMIANMQSRTDHIVDLIEDTGEVVRDQEMSVNETEESFEDVFRHVSDNVATMNQIIDSMKDMSNNKDHLIQNIDQISTVTEDTAAASEQVSASVQESNAAMDQLNGLAEELEDVASNMEQELEKFQLETDEETNLPLIEPDSIEEKKAG
ncbi:methyl-accepting chemotaxis protein [Halobacillus salinus]|uniref:methyl-accepting chemotaxis protein n=1 Tax=Halobacillus salinus TaxID=192814 RepID=UPI001590CB61|nr:methyl-accepting chemotaxis protein [Halobacillus salinus]